MSSNKSDNIIIADSQWLVVETLKAMIISEEQFQLAGAVETRNELFYLLGRTKPGLLITDIATMDYDGLSDLKLIRDDFPQTRILILTNMIGRNEFLTLTKFGIKNIVYKNVDRDELLSAIQATLKGKKFYSEEIIDMYLDINDNKYPEDEPKNLTASEIEIVKLIANGLTTKEIADKRNISYHTVSTHRKNIFRKIEVSNASELIMHAIKAGWIDNIEYYI
jgi:DNA-binding NarL/FixJ family response regulator